MKFLVSFHFGILWNYVAEVFETRIRTFSIGFALTIGMIFNSFCPFYVFFANMYNIFPLVTSLPIVLIAVPCAIYAPETKNKEISA